MARARGGRRSCARCDRGAHGAALNASLDACRTRPALIIGALLLAALAIGGQPVLGLGMFAVMAVYSAVLVAFGGRSETIGVLSGRPVDERLAGFNIHATAIAGTVAIVVAILGPLWAIAHGQSGNDFAVVAAAAGLGYFAAILGLRWRG